MWTGGLLAALVALGAVGPKQPVTPTGAAPVAATSSPTTTKREADAEDTVDAEAAAAKMAAADRVAADGASAKAAGAKAAAAKAAIEKAAAAKRASTFVVIDVVDGDTVRLANGEKVRVVGIDTPEQGECNYETATRKMEALVLGKTVTLAESDEDRDRYGRLLRYLDVGNRDAGLEMLKAGLAIARYDSCDGYGAHPRGDSYIAADTATPNRPCATPSAASRPPASEPQPQPPTAWRAIARACPSRATWTAPTSTGR
jgi:endonuclease YncB( thermonuclease family)